HAGPVLRQAYDISQECIPLPLGGNLARPETKFTRNFDLLEKHGAGKPHCGSILAPRASGGDGSRDPRDAGALEVASAVGVLREILLVVAFGEVEFRRRRD